MIPVNPSPSDLGRENAVLWGKGRSRHYVRGFAGPLSMKAMVKGRGTWATDEGRFELEPGSWLVLNDGQTYALTIESEEPVETFCVFFARGFVESVKASLLRPDGRLLDEPEAALGHDFMEMQRRGDEGALAALLALRKSLDQGVGALAVDERMLALAHDLLAAELDLRAAAARLPSARASTREELLRRLRRGRDFLEGALVDGATVRLGRVAREAALSPYHFHRLFRAAYGETPRAYLSRRRLERARELLARADRAVMDVCFEVGFESVGSFSTLFRRHFGVAPGAVRRAGK